MNSFKRTQLRTLSGSWMRAAPASSYCRSHRQCSVYLPACTARCSPNTVPRDPAGHRRHCHPPNHGRTFHFHPAHGPPRPAAARPQLAGCGAPTVSLQRRAGAAPGTAPGRRGLELARAPPPRTPLESMCRLGRLAGSPPVAAVTQR